MKRPVPEAHMTSPPQMVSMPRMALPISSSYCPLMLAPWQAEARPTKVVRAALGWPIANRPQVEQPAPQSFLVPHRSHPKVHAQRHEQGGGNQLRDHLIAVERRLDPIFRVTRDQPAGRAEDAAERASRHQSGGDDEIGRAHV